MEIEKVIDILGAVGEFAEQVFVKVREEIRKDVIREIDREKVMTDEKLKSIKEKNEK
jgi:hypothetical protein